MKPTDLPHARSIMTTINQAKVAVEQGHTVHWKSDAYTLRKDSKGEWWVDSITGFVTPLSGDKPEDFYIGQNGAKNGATHAPTVTRPR
jgi:hypothetical protein